MSSEEHPTAGTDRQGFPAEDDGTSVRVVHDLRGELSVRVTEAGDRVLAAVAGEVDYACADTLEHVLCRSLRQGARGLEVDLSAVPFFDCAGLNALLRARSVAGRSGARMTVTAMSPAVERVLALTGTHALFLIEPADRSRPAEPGEADRPPDRHPAHRRPRPHRTPALAHRAGASPAAATRPVSPRAPRAVR